MHGWVALLHATTGGWEQALHHSAIEARLRDRSVDDGTAETDDHVFAALHARWRRGALLSAAGDHEAAMRVHADLDLVLSRLAETHGRTAKSHSLDDGFTRAALVRARARTKAALGTQALRANRTQIAIDALESACDLFNHLQVHPYDPVLHPILPLFERCTAQFEQRMRP